MQDVVDLVRIVGVIRHLTVHQLSRFIRIPNFMPELFLGLFQTLVDICLFLIEVVHLLVRHNIIGKVFNTPFLIDLDSLSEIQEKGQYYCLWFHFDMLYNYC